MQAAVQRPSRSEIARAEAAMKVHLANVVDEAKALVSDGETFLTHGVADAERIIAMVESRVHNLLGHLPKIRAVAKELPQR